MVPPEAKEPEDKDSEKEKPKLVDLQLQIVEKIKDDSEKRTYLDDLIRSNPKHLPLLVASLKAVKEEADPQEITKAADLILAEIDEHELAAYLGRKPPPAEEQTEEDKKIKKEMDIKKSAWTLAYSRKVQASHKQETSLDEQNKLFSQYRAFLDSPEKDPDFGLALAKRDIAAKVNQA